MDPKPPNSKVQVVVIGDPGTGKSSLIVLAMTGTFLEKVPSVLLPTSLPMDTFPVDIPLTVIDTSSDPEHLNDTFKTCQTADVILLTYSCNSPSTVERLTSFWLPELRRLNISVPVILTGCKLDLRSKEDEDYKQVMLTLMKQFGEVETCFQCSALNQNEVLEVFYQAQHWVLYPTAPLCDEENQTLKPRFVSALKRTFILSDRDRDGVLNEKEINDYQIEYFGSHLMPDEICGIKENVQEEMDEGWNDDGLTLTGFLFLQATMIEKGSVENVWLLLRKCGYDNNIMLQDDVKDDDIHELTDEVVKFLSECFYKFDGDDKDGSLSTDELENLFSNAPEKPDWFDDLEEMLSLDRFISVWALMALVDPVITFAYLEYLGYEEDFKSAFRDQHSERSCFQCFVFGPEKAGKSAILDCLVGKSFSVEYTPTTTERFASNMIETLEERRTKKSLIMRELSEQIVESLWSKKNSLATCDVAIFVYDTSDEDSWKKMMDLLRQFATHCENSGYQVPCSIVAAKNDLVNDGSKVISVYVKMGVDIPILSINAKSRNDNILLFSWIIYVAQHPHMFIPETEDGIKQKKHARLLKHSLVLGSIAVAASLVGLASYKIYASRKKLLRRFM